MGCLHPLVENAYKVLNGGTLERAEALALAENVEGADVLDLVSLANKVRRKFAPPFHRCSIVNAKSGKCGENCRFCAQSGHYAAKIESYPLLAKDDVDKRRILRAIGPVWDGNEVWLLTAGGALFAAFAPAYACVFSGFYLAIMLVLFVPTMPNGPSFGTSASSLAACCRRCCWAWPAATSSKAWR